MSEEKENHQKIIPNDFGEVGYRVKGQNFIQDVLIMKIETEDIDSALESIKEENEGKTVVLNKEASKGDDYIIEVS